MLETDQLTKALNSALGHEESALWSHSLNPALTL